MNNTLTSKEKWEAIWAGTRLPNVKRPVHDVQRQFGAYLPRSGDHSLIEIGCAPGSWMAYFNKSLGYRVAGLEYAEAAAEATKANMELLNIDASVIVDDFLTFDCEHNQYDIVFSAGFIEHFRDVSGIVQRLSLLSRKYVVTIVPNVLGVNGFISKTIRPRIFAEHNPIDMPQLDGPHASCGLQTLFCDYVGGVKFFMPGEGNDFFAAHKLLAKAVNMPVQASNRLSEQLQIAGGYTPRTKLLSDCLLYIGVKQEMHKRLAG